tara:strand:+ start:7806 stop:8489 length:684 start_codon:yes stop_codon:yes gene_type:complete
METVANFFGQVNSGNLEESNKDKVNYSEFEKELNKINDDDRKILYENYYNALNGLTETELSELGNKSNEEIMEVLSNIEVNKEKSDVGSDSDSDSDYETYEDDYKKLEQDVNTNVLLNYHPEIQQISNEELLTLSTITRDKNGNIVDPLHTTIPILTRYEKAKVLGLRAKQLNHGSKPFIKIPRDMINGITIANKELEEQKIPFIIRRPLPNGGSEYWNVSDLELLE